MSIADIASSPPPPGPALRIRNEWADRLLGSDPGLNRLRLALQTVLTIAIALGAEALFVHFTNALQLQTHGARLPTAQAAKVVSTVITLAQARCEWLALGSSEGEGDDTFEAAVALFGGWLPGSAEVSTAASLERGNRLFDQIRLPRYTRTAIQMGVAVGIAIVLGDLLSEKRFYWAVIAAFITFMGANNAGEQSRKALHRVAGTVVGIAVGSLLAQAVGHDTYSSLAVILIAMFFAAYLLRISYAFMVIGITVMVSQLYVHLGEFSNSLLLVRLEETAIGAGVAIAVVALVFPLRTSRVLSVALRDHVQALARLVDRATGCLLGRENDTETTLREDARALDASYQALIATAQPLRRHLDTRRLVRIASASRDYSRNLVANVGAVGSLDTETSQEIANAAHPLLVGGGSEPRGGPSHDPRHGRSGPASRVGPTRVAVIRGLNARIVGWTLTSDCVLAVWRRSG